MMLDQPLFPGDSGIIKALGTPFPRADQDDGSQLYVTKLVIQVFRPRTAPEAIDMISKLLEDTPGVHLSIMQAKVHPFFDELRQGSQMGRTFVVQFYVCF